MSELTPRDRCSNGTPSVAKHKETDTQSVAERDGTDTQSVAERGGTDSSRPDASSFDRGVSAVIGAILMFALVIALLALLQMTAVPALNEESEFQHNERVQTDMVGVDETVQQVAATGTARTTSIEAGLQYSPRMFFVNPPPAAGTVQTTDASEVSIANARATGETGDYWNGDERTFETRSLEYVPDYNEYGGAPETVYEPWAVYNRFDERTLAQTDQGLVDNRRITLVALEGERANSRAGDVPIRIKPTSTPTQTVPVRDDGEPLTLTIPTALTEDEWADLLADELDSSADSDNDRYVTDFECQRAPPEPCGALTITLQQGETYELALGAVGLGSGVPEEDAVYLTDIEGHETSVSAGGRQRLVVEARDRFDNPVSGVSVTDALDGVGTIRAVDSVTDDEGRATFVYDAPDDLDENRDVDVTLGFDDEYPRQQATFGIRVMGATGSSPGDGGSTPGTTPSVTITDVDANSAGNTDRYIVSAEATAPNSSLERLEYELQSTETEDVIDTATAPVSGERDSASERVRAQGDAQLEEYRIVVTAVTTDGTTTRTETSVSGSES